MIKSIDYSELEKAFSTLRIKMTVSDFTNFAMQKDFSAEQILLPHFHRVMPLQALQWEVLLVWCLPLFSI